jgi:hypothetical protein
MRSTRVGILAIGILRGKGSMLSYLLKPRTPKVLKALKVGPAVS